MELRPTKKSILTGDQRIRIFISSTLGELEPERTAVKKAIFELKLIPVYFESGARPHPPREVYRAGIEQSNLFIGIYWESYGWVAPDQDISGIEDEFLLGEGKPKLIYLKNTDGQRDPRLTSLIQKIEAKQNISYSNFSNVEQLVELIKNDVMLLISESFGIDSAIREGVFIGPSYGELLWQELEKKNLIDRNKIILDIKKLTKNYRKIMITGAPGIGKTSILGQISREIDTLYISIKNKTVYQVCSNLANHLSIRRNINPKTIFSEEDSKTALQEELANTSITVLLDDVDQNTEVFHSLMSLEFYDCSLIYSARKKIPFADESVHEYEIPPLTRDEVNKYLTTNDKFLSPGELERLIDSSQGNPLYLYYFITYQVSPYPDGLINYHDTLWEQLQPLQKEVLNFVAHSYAILTVSDVHALLNWKATVTLTLMDTSSILDSINPMVRVTNKKLEIFHPYFEEFITEKATFLAIESHYHLILGEFALERKWIVPSAVHLINAKDMRADGIIMDAISASYLLGDWLTCENLLNYALSRLEVEKNSEKEGQTRFFLSQILYELGRYSDSKFQLKLAKELMQKSKDIDSLHKVAIWSNLLYIQEGKIEKAIKGLKQSIDKAIGKDDYEEAILQLNLSYAYIQKSDFEDGVEAADRALGLFTELSDSRGKYSAIVNLSCCVGGLGDYSLQEKYALDIIRIAEEGSNLRLKAAGLNHIAIVFRRKHDFYNAERVLQEAIGISQQIGSYELEALNIANLGNVYLDKGEYSRAEVAYTESLNISKERHVESHEAKALELLARLKYRMRSFQISKEFAEDALNLHKKFGDPLRMATTSNYLGQANEKLGREKVAAKNYQKAGDYYRQAKEWRDAAYCYRLALGLWNKHGVLKNMQYCLQQGLKSAFQESSPTLAQDILAEVPQDSKIENIELLYEQTFDLYLHLKNKRDFSLFMQNYFSFCASSSNNNISMLKKAIFRLVEGLKNNEYPELINALAITLSQTGPSFASLEELDRIATNIAAKLDGLYFRRMSDDFRIWTVGTEWRNGMIIQIETLSEDNIIARVAMALALILFANNQIIENDLSEFGNALEDGISLKIISQQDFETNTGMKVDNGKTSGESHNDAQVSLSETTKFDDDFIPLIVVLHHDFEREANVVINPGNKAYIWLLMLVYSGIVSQCLHKQRDNISELPKKSREFCEKIFLSPTNDK